MSALLLFISSSVPQRVPDAIQQFSHSAFAQIPVGALIQQSLDLGLIMIEAGIKEDAGFGLSLVQRFEEGGAILAGQIEVQNNEVQFGPVGLKQGFRRVFDSEDVETGFFEKIA